MTPVGRYATATAAAVSICLAGCSNEAPPPRPSDAAGVTATEEYAFGDAIRDKDWTAARRILDQLEVRFGKPIRMRGYNLDVGADPQAVRAHYTAAFARLGWTEWTLATQPDRAWAVAFVSPRESQVVAIEALNPSESASGRIPLNILTNLPDGWITAPAATAPDSAR